MLSNKKFIFPILFFFLLGFILFVSDVNSLYINFFNDTLTTTNFTNTLPQPFSEIKYQNFSYDDYVHNIALDITGYKQPSALNQTCYECRNSTTDATVFYSGAFTYNPSRHSYFFFYKNETGFQDPYLIEISDSNFTKINAYDGHGCGISPSLGESWAIVDKYGGIWCKYPDFPDGKFINVSLTGEQGTATLDPGGSSTNPTNAAYDSVNHSLIRRHGDTYWSGCGDDVNSACLVKTDLSSPVIKYDHSYCILPLKRVDAAYVVINQSGGDIYLFSDFGGAGSNVVNITKINFVENGTCGAELYYDATLYLNGSRYNNEWAIYSYGYNNNTDTFFGLAYNGTSTPQQISNQPFYPEIIFLNFSYPKTVNIDTQNDGVSEFSSNELSSVQNNQNLNATLINNWIKNNCVFGSQCFIPFNFSFYSHGILGYSDINFTLNDKPTISSIPTINVTHNQTASFSVGCTDNDNSTFLYFTNSTLFSINSSGNVTITPNLTEEGLTNIQFICNDGYANSSANFLLNVSVTYPQLFNFAPSLLSSYFKSQNANISVVCNDTLSTINNVTYTLISPTGTTNKTLALSSGQIYRDILNLTVNGDYNITHFNCQDTSGEWNTISHSNLSFTVSSTFPQLFNFAPALLSSYTNGQTANITVECNDTISLIDEVTYTLISPTDTTNETLTLTSGQTYQDLLNLPTNGNYNITHFNCKDVLGESNTTLQSTLSFTVSAAQVGGGGGGGGGGGSSQPSNLSGAVEEAILAVTCGNAICDRNEHIFNCPNDCKINLDTALCFNKNDPACISTQFIVTDLALYFLIGISLVFIVNTQIIQPMRKKRRGKNKNDKTN